MKKNFLFLFFFLDVFSVPAVRSSLKRVVAKSNSGVKKPKAEIKCPVCPDRKFTSSQPLNGFVQHLQRTHGLKAVTCPQCKKEFDPTGLQNHLRDNQKHGNYLEALYAVYKNNKQESPKDLFISSYNASLNCLHCGKFFDSHEVLNRHYRAVKIAHNRNENKKNKHTSSKKDSSSKRKCPYCNFNGVNLSCHLKKCHSDISVDDRYRILAVTSSLTI